MRAEQLYRLYGRRAGRVPLATAPESPAGFTPATDAEISAIATDGWRVTYDTPPSEMDPAGDPKYLSVQRAGFTGVETPIANGGENILLLKRERQVYPNQASLTADSVTLAHHVYAGDKLYSSAGVLEGLTNASTLAAPKPIWACLNPPLECVRTTLHTIRIVVAHTHGRNGKPVAGVRLRMSDGSTTVDYDETELVDYTLPNGVHVSVYAFEVDFSDFASGAYVTADPWLYPHVGDLYKASVDGYAYPAAHATVIKFWNDHAASEPRVHVFQSTGSGDDGTGAASTTEATARAAPFATYGAAMTAAMALTTGGTAAQEVILTVLAGTMELDASQTSRSASNYPMTIRRDPLDTRANCKITQTTNASGRLMDRHIIDGLTIDVNPAGANDVIFTSSSGTGAYLDGLSIWTDCEFDLTGTKPNFGIGYHNGFRWFENCDGDDVSQLKLFTNTFFHAAHIIGGTFGSDDANQIVYTAVGWDPMRAGRDGKITRLRAQSILTNMTPQDGRFIGWCGLQQGAVSNPMIVVEQEDDDMGALGAAVVMNVMVSYGTHAGKSIGCFSDSIDQDCENVVIVGNTAVGEGGSGRVNAFYGRPTDPPSRKAGAVVGNIFEQLNFKADVFEADPDALQGAEQRYAVDCYGNVLLSGDSTSSTADYGPDQWKGEVAPPYTVTGTPGVRIDAGFADDQSKAVAGAGGGDYTPSGSGLDAAAMPAALAHYPFDRAGRVIGADWLPGAYQKAA